MCRVLARTLPYWWWGHSPIDVLPSGEGNCTASKYSSEASSLEFTLDNIIFQSFHGIDSSRVSNAVSGLRKSVSADHVEADTDHEAFFRGPTLLYKQTLPSSSYFFSIKTLYIGPQRTQSEGSELIVILSNRSPRFNLQHSNVFFTFMISS